METKDLNLYTERAYHILEKLTENGLLDFRKKGNLWVYRQKGKVTYKSKNIRLAADNNKNTR